MSDERTTKVEAVDFKTAGDEIDRIPDLGETHDDVDKKVEFRGLVIDVPLKGPMNMQVHQGLPIFEIYGVLKAIMIKLEKQLNLTGD